MRFHISPRTLALSLTLAATAALTACGSSDSLGVKTASSNLNVTLDSKTGTQTLPALQAAKSGFAFSSGVPDFGTTGTATTVTIDGTSAAPTFKIGAGSASASGSFGFGSCKFTIGSTTFTAGPLSAAGTTVTISPCNFTLQTAGQPAVGAAANIPALLTLGTLKSTAVQIATVIAADGSVQVGGATIGSVTTVVTGATGSN